MSRHRGTDNKPLVWTGHHRFPACALTSLLACHPGAALCDQLTLWAIAAPEWQARSSERRLGCPGLSTREACSASRIKMPGHIRIGQLLSMPTQGALNIFLNLLALHSSLAVPRFISRPRSLRVIYARQAPRGRRSHSFRSAEKLGLASTESQAD